jgi:hypothetical protein
VAQRSHELHHQIPSGRKYGKPDQAASQTKIQKCEKNHHGILQIVSNQNSEVLYLRSNTVRPTDENQHGSTRPNLMSPSRPGGGEDNILAMLERDAGRGRASQFSSHPRMAWYAGAGAVVVAMVAALGWLAWENATKTRELPLETTRALRAGDTRIAAAQPAPAAPAAALVHTEHPAPAHPAASGQAEVVALQTAGAAIIDSQAAPAEAPVQLAQAQAEAKATSAPGAPAQVAQPSKLPPLVLLPPEEAAPKRKPAAPVAAAATPRPAAAAPSKATAAPRPAAKADAAPAPAPAPRRAARLDGAPASRPAAKAPPHRPARPVLARAKKAQTPAAPARSADASADTDVALISAIIMHSSKHAGERAKAEAAKDCDGGKCPGKPAAKR